MGWKTTDATVASLSDSRNRQLAPSLFTRDAQNAKAVDTTTSDTTCVSVGDTLLVRLRWTETDGSGVAVNRVAAWVLTTGAERLLERRYCATATTVTSSVTAAHGVVGTPGVTCRSAAGATVGVRPRGHRRSLTSPTRAAPSRRPAVGGRRDVAPPAAPDGAPGRPDDGSALVLALVFLMIFGSWVGVVLQFAATGQRTTVIVRAEATSTYAGGGALEGAINAARSDLSVGSLASGTTTCFTLPAGSRSTTRPRSRSPATRAAGSGSPLGGASTSQPD